MQSYVGVTNYVYILLLSKRLFIMTVEWVYVHWCMWQGVKIAVGCHSNKTN